MKRIVLLLITAITIVSLTGCGQHKSALPTAPVSTQAAASEAPTQKATEKATEKPTDPPVKETTEPPTEPLTPEHSGKENWRDLYLTQLSFLDQESYAGYQLVYIDDDDIPELYAAPVAHVVSGYVYWINNDEVCSQHVSLNGFKYIEKENLFINSGGWTGKGVDEVFRINGNEADVVASGEFCTVKGNEYYRWNGEDLSEGDYQNAKSAVFDSDKGIAPSDLYSFEEIKSILNH